MSCARTKSAREGTRRSNPNEKQLGARTRRSAPLETGNSDLARTPPPEPATERLSSNLARTPPPEPAYSRMPTGRTPGHGLGAHASARACLFEPASAITLRSKSLHPLPGGVMPKGRTRRTAIHEDLPGARGVVGKITPACSARKCPGATRLPPRAAPSGWVATDVLDKTEASSTRENRNGVGAGAPPLASEHQRSWG